MTFDKSSSEPAASVSPLPAQAAVASLPAARVIVRAKDMRKLTGIPDSTRADKENPKSPRFDPTWPKKIRLGARSTGYFLDEVLAWLEKQRKA
ncbi:MAG: AlpA family phage regulatory protein [bacterium]|nr:AlpA family phage regulatory protein [bacterium]